MWKRGRNSSPCVTYTFLMKARMRSTGLRWWPRLSGSISPFFGATGSLFHTSTLICPCLALQRVAQTSGNKKSTLQTSAKIHLARQTGHSNAHMTIHQHEKENFSATLIAWNGQGFIKGFAFGFQEDFSPFIPSGKAYAFNSITIN